MVVRQGDVFWVDLPLPQGSGPGYRHPAVVIQNDAFNMSAIATVVVCLITSSLRLAECPGNVLLRKGEGGLPRQSVANITQILTVDRSVLAAKLGTLSRNRVWEILAGVGVLLRPTTGAPN